MNLVPLPLVCTSVPACMFIYFTVSKEAMGPFQFFPYHCKILKICIERICAWQKRLEMENTLWWSLVELGAAERRRHTYTRVHVHAYNICWTLKTFVVIIYTVACASRLCTISAWKLSFYSCFDCRSKLFYLIPVCSTTYGTARWALSIIFVTLSWSNKICGPVSSCKIIRLV